jgi:cyclic 2,3-diphosphoglycerate synthetase
VVAASGSLSDRRRLDLELEEMRGLGVEAYLTEIKAAAVDVITRRGAEEGKPVFYCDNDPVIATGLAAGEEGSLDEALLGLAEKVVGESGGAG